MEETATGKCHYNLEKAASCHHVFLGTMTMILYHPLLIIVEEIRGT